MVYFVRIVCALLLPSAVLLAQPRAGDVLGMVGGGATKLHGDYSDDVVGSAARLGLRYLPMDRLWIEARFTLAEYRWKITPSDLAGHPEYFGQGATFSGTYPGTTTAIEATNESRATMGDVLLHYVLVPNIPASPYLTAGIGVLDFAPSNSAEHSALPNNLGGVYNKTIFNIVLGGGVRIPISRRVGIEFTGEYRFAMSKYLDDVAFNGTQDGISVYGINVTYHFNEPNNGSDFSDEVDCEQLCNYCVDNCDCDECNVTDCKCSCLCGITNCDCPRCSCCCCCCCGKQQTAVAPAAAASVAPAPPADPVPVAGGGGPKPEKMDVPCPQGQHRECYGPPGYGICVDDDPPKGPEPIRWDLAETLPDGSLLRSTDGKWYRKQVMPNGEVRISKGTLPFEAAECLECKKKAEQQR